MEHITLRPTPELVYKVYEDCDRGRIDAVTDAYRDGNPQWPQKLQDCLFVAWVMAVDVSDIHGSYGEIVLKIHERLTARYDAKSPMMDDDR